VLLSAQVRNMEAGNQLVMHGCPSCRVEYQYQAASLEELHTLLQRHEPLLRCPRCAPPPGRRDQRACSWPAASSESDVFGAAN
jgi:hypothetical protein